MDNGKTKQNKTKERNNKKENLDQEKKGNLCPVALGRSDRTKTKPHVPCSLVLRPQGIVTITLLAFEIIEEKKNKAFSFCG